MNLVEHLLSKLSEECHEVGQRALKAQCFGLDEVQPGQPLTNRERLSGELDDLFGVLALMREGGIYDFRPDPAAVEAKKEKLKKFMGYARELGTLTD